MLVVDVNRGRPRHAIGHEVHFGILGLDRLIEEPIVLVVGRAAVLVADLHVLEVERGRVSGLGSQRSPLAVRRTVGILDRVQGVLNILQLRHVDRRPWLVRPAACGSSRS